MEVNIIKSLKDEIHVELDDLTIAETLKVYLNKDSSVLLATWKRDHPTKNPVLVVKTKGKSPKKAISDAVSLVTKELDKIESDFKKLK
jgi:DNA-directed RNA polymerase subunit L|tara:strand:- start:130 stop:393 length:264 start_codon:yes stop_codon:yes gene_type:complete